MTVIDYMLGQGTYPLRGLIVTGANPVLTNPNAMKVAKAFAGLELLVSRELFMTQTARLAHYVLPVASFLERSELHYHPHLQMVTLTNKVLDVPGVQGAILPGIIQITHGWDEASVNFLTDDKLNDPVTGLPLFNLLKLSLTWIFLAVKLHRCRVISYQK